MSSAGDLRDLLRGRDFRRLLGTRLTSQAGDGVFQVALASVFFFSPERAATAGQIAAAFAVLLLPYSLVGPFAGVLLDRWRRRTVLVRANAVRAGLVVVLAALVASGPPGPLLYAAVLACLSVNRFFLAGLSAALPHVLPQRDPLERERDLVVANALTTTTGTLAAVLGGGLGYLLRRGLGEGAAGDARLAMVAAGTYALAALLATRMHRDLLGPDADGRRPLDADALRAVAVGLVDGARHVVERRPASGALAAIGSHRFFYGVSTVAAILLYRNHFNDPADVEAGLAGLAGVVAASGAGFGLAAFVTPPVTRRIPPQRWIVLCLAAAALTESVFVLALTEAMLLVGGFVVGFAAQAVKICVDTIVQESMEDAYRGRVFSLYDVVFNVAFVAAAACAALVLPEDGASRPVYAGITAGYAVTALAYWRLARQDARDRALLA